MNEFARILTEILEQGKKREHPFHVKELAQRAGIAASYLSNLRHAKQGPPTQKTLLKLTEALRQLQVSAPDLQRLNDAYNREQLSDQDKSNLLASLFSKEQYLLKRLKHGIQTKELTLNQWSKKRRMPLRELPAVEAVVGDYQTFLWKALQLLERAKEANLNGGRIYLTHFHSSPSEQEEPEHTRLIDLLRSFLWTDSTFEVYHLWASHLARDLMLLVITDFLAQYIGTSHGYLYDIPNAQFLCDYVVVKGVGFIEARPIADQQYWFRTVLLTETEKERFNELSAVISYLEQLLGPEELRKPLVETEASGDQFSASRLNKIKELTDDRQTDDRQKVGKERLLIKATFANLFRPPKAVQSRLQAANIPQDQIDLYLCYHTNRVADFQHHLKHGKARAIYTRDAFKHEFQTFLARPAVADDLSARLRHAEADLLQAQIIEVLRALRAYPNFHIALTEASAPVRVALTGDNVILFFHSPDAGELPFDHDMLKALAMTSHPDMVYRLRKDFDAKWTEIEDIWRTDSAEGRKQVVNFIVAEALKAMLQSNAPGQELYAFAGALVDATAYLDFETYVQELYTREQTAKEIVIVEDDFPTITMPVSIGPWDSTSPIRTRQRLLYAVLRDIENLRLIVTQVGLEKYWETGQFGAYSFRQEWVAQHFQYNHDLCLEFQDKLTIEILLAPEHLPVNFWIVDQEFVSFEKIQMYGKQSGIILRDKELAQALLAYFERNLSPKCPETMKGTRNVAQWLEERFEVAHVKGNE